MKKLIEVLQQQIALQDRRYEEQQRRYEEQQRRYEEQQRHYEEQLQVFKNLIRGRKQDGDQKLKTAATTAAATPNFPPFDSTSELWSNYWSRFRTFANAHSVPNEKAAKIFLTNQTSTTYKMLSYLAAQETPAKDINNLTMEQITIYMKNNLVLNVSL